MADLKQTAFDLLQSEGFTSQSKWEQVSASTAYRELVPVTGERKQLFAEFLNFIRKKEGDERRKRVQSARSDFEKALSEWVTPENCNSLTFPRAAEHFHAHTFWPLLPEDELDDIFQSYVDDFERNNRSLIADHRRSQISKLTEKFAQDERCNSDTPFEKVIPLYPGHSKFDLLRGWEEFVEESDRAETARKRKLRHRKERRARLAFRQVLSDLDISDKSWPEIHQLVKDRECYIELVGSRGSQPFDLYLAVGGKEHQSRSRSASIESLDSRSSISVFSEK